MSIRTRIAASFVTLLSVALLAGCQSAPQQKSEAPAPQTVAAAPQKAEANKVKGKVKTVVGKSSTISVEVPNKGLMVFKFNAETKFKNATSYKDLHADELLNIEFKTVGAENIATLLSKVVAELPPGIGQIGTDELKALVAKGTESGSYLLYDARPPARYHQAHIPTSLSLPLALVEQAKKEGKKIPLLPEDKNKLVIFYCGGPT